MNLMASAFTSGRALRRVSLVSILPLAGTCDCRDPAGPNAHEGRVSHAGQVVPRSHHSSCTRQLGKRGPCRRGLTLQAAAAHTGRCIRANASATSRVQRGGRSYYQRGSSRREHYLPLTSRAAASAMQCESDLIDIDTAARPAVSVARPTRSSTVDRTGESSRTRCVSDNSRSVCLSVANVCALSACGGGGGIRAKSLPCPSCRPAKLTDVAF